MRRSKAMVQARALRCAALALAPACASDAGPPTRAAYEKPAPLLEDLRSVLDFGLDGPPAAAGAPGTASFVAVAALDGLVVAARGAPRAGYRLELWTDGDWRELGRMRGGEVWVGPVVAAGAALRATRVGSEQSTPTFTARGVELGWAEDALPALLAGDAVSTSLALSTLPAEGLGAASLRVSLERADEEPLYLPEGCADEDCWTETAGSLLESADLAEMETALALDFFAPALGPAEQTLRAELALHTEAAGRVVVARAERSLLLLGGRWAWGDLHAHSRWSNDGCEDPDSACGHRGEEPAADFFENAADAGLDFAAITDHAEWDLYFPEGAEGEGLPVWDGQAGAAVDALDGPVLPVLGYEWSHGSDALEGEHQRGSHRTVLLSDPSACEEYRIGGLYADEDWVPDLGAWVFTTENERIADTVSELWEDLDAADGTCGTDLRWITFAHHPAYEIPQVTDWNLEENRPTLETLVEIYSEHGSSECLDPEAEGCDFAYNSRQTYYPDGSVQRALDLGFQLGFVAGTDSHDARPGSLDDGPSAVAHWRDTDGDGALDAVSTQFADGGLTGALVPGDLDHDGLFDALDARRTAATSGPRPALRAYARSASGAVHLPGELLSLADGPYELSLALDSRLDEGTGALLAQIDRVGPGGVIEDTSAEAGYEGGWAPSAAGEWTYLRLRYLHEDGAEERVWLSPWFVE